MIVIFLDDPKCTEYCSRSVARIIDVVCSINENYSLFLTVIAYLLFGIAPVSLQYHDFVSMSLFWEKVPSLVIMVKCFTYSFQSKVKK